MVQIRVSPFNFWQNFFGSGGIRTHAPEETGALNQRLRPLGHATLLKCFGLALVICLKVPVLLQARKKERK